MEEVIVRYVRLRHVEMESEAQAPDWAAVTCTGPHGGEEFHLCWMSDTGQCLGWEDFDDLETSLNWAATNAAIHPGEWRSCRFEVTAKDGAVPWTEFATVLGSEQPQHSGPVR